MAQRSPPNERPVLEPVRLTEVLSINRRQQVNQYKRDLRVGKGQHGEVYLCYDETAAYCPVALKVVRRSNPRDKIKLLRRTHQQMGNAWLGSTEQSIRREIAVMKKCRDCGHIVQLIEVIDDPRQEKIYLAMEYLPGGQVQWTDKHHNPTLTISQIRRIMRDVINGLEYLHYHGIIHRDIKPANLLWTDDRSTVKIVDFGTAFYNPIFDKGKYATRDTAEDLKLFPEADLLKRIGTPSFLAPEVVWFPDKTSDPSPATSSSTLSSGLQMRGNRPASALDAPSVFPPSKRPPITKAIDIWALGVTFYCLLSGRTPFNVTDLSYDNIHQSEYMLYHQICSRDWIAPATLGVEQLPSGGRHPTEANGEGCTIMRLLDQLLQKDPSRRIALPQLKRNPWILLDLEDSISWLLSTSLEAPEAPAHTSKHWSSKLGRVIRKMLSHSK